MIWKNSGGTETLAIYSFSYLLYFNLLKKNKAKFNKTSYERVLFLSSWGRGSGLLLAALWGLIRLPFLPCSGRVLPLAGLVPSERFILSLSK